jgi:hypothetical protein
MMNESLLLVHPGRLAGTVQCSICYNPMILGVAYSSYAFQKTAQSYTIVTGFWMQSTFREQKMNFMSPLKGLASNCLSQIYSKYE